MITRHKAAIRRKELSLPVKCAVRDELLALSTSFFDFGCGHEHDLALLGARGYQCEGFDPAFRPDAPLQAADVVNLTPSTRLRVRRERGCCTPRRSLPPSSK
jgi:DNA phosphorothioation-associated putative methyltransferase